MSSKTSVLFASLLLVVLLTMPEIANGEPEAKKSKKSSYDKGGDSDLIPIPDHYYDDLEDDLENGEDSHRNDVGDDDYDDEDYLDYEEDDFEGRRKNEKTSKVFLFFLVWRPLCGLEL